MHRFLVRLSRLATAMATASLLPAALRAQAPAGRIVGRIIDAASGRGISDAGVQIVGTTLGTSSGVEGRFVSTFARPR